MNKYILMISIILFVITLISNLLYNLTEIIRYCIVVLILLIIFIKRKNIKEFLNKFISEGR